MNINLKKPEAHLYDTTAEEFAGLFKKPETSQLRRFYDEIVHFETLARQAMPNTITSTQTINSENSALSADKTPSNWSEILPLVKMMNAKAAYALGRGHIDESFYNVFKDLIRQVDTAQDLQSLKLFLEATIGFRKLKEFNAKNQKGW